MEKEELEGVWTPLEERALILMQFSLERSLLKIGRSLEIEWFEGREELGQDQREVSARKIAEKVEEPKELEDLMNAHELIADNCSSSTLVRYYHATGEKEGLKIEGTRFFTDLKRVREELKDIRHSSPDILPLMRGILLSAGGSTTNACRVTSYFKDAVSESRRFYDDEDFSPKDIKGLPGKLSGIYSEKIGDERRYTLERCYVGVIWDVLEWVETRV